MNFRLGSSKEMAQMNGSIRSGESSQNQILNNQQSLRSSLRTPQGMLQRPHNYLRPNNLIQGNNNNVGARATLPPRVPFATSSSNNSSALMAAARYGRPLPLPLPTPSVPISRMGNSLNNTPLSLNPPTQNSSSSSSTGVGVGVGGNLHGYANGFPNPSRRSAFHNPNLNLPYRGDNSNRVNNSSVVNNFNNPNPIPRVDHMNNNNFPHGVNAFPAQLPPIQIKDLDLLSSSSGGVNRERGMKMKQPMCEFEETELTLGNGASKRPRMSSAPPGYNYHNYFQNLLQSDQKEELELFKDEKKNEFSFSEITTDAAKEEEDDHEEDLDLSLHL